MIQANTVSSAQQNTNLRNLVAHQKNLANKAAMELATGLKTDVYMTPGAAPAKSLDLRGRLTVNEAFLTSNKVLASKLNATSDVMTDVLGSAQDFLNLLTGGDLASTNRETLKESAKRAMTDISNMLNTTYGGEFLFSGLSVNQKPIDLDAGYVSTYLGDTTGKLTAQVDENTTLEYGIRADNPGFQQLLGALSTIINTDLEAMDYGTFQTFRDAQVTAIGGANQAILSDQTGLGDQQARLDARVERQENLFKIYNNSIHEVEGVDPEEAAIRLEGMDIQLEATFQVTARLSRMSFLNYMN